MNTKHYIMEAKPKEGTSYNSLHDEVNGCEAVIIEAKPGDIGWFSYKYEDYPWNRWHTMHTSIINGVNETDEGIFVNTRNTIYVFKEIK